MPGWAIAQGDVDSGNGFSFVVQLAQNVDGGSTRCSAVVLTGRWLLTAAHCTHGTFTADTCGDPAGVIHPPINGWISDGWPSNPIHVQSTSNTQTGVQVLDIHSLAGKLDPCSPYARSADWALLELSQPLNPAQFGRMRPPGIGFEPTCPFDSQFDGLIIGFGDDQLLGGDPGPPKTFNFVDDWERDPTSGGRAAYDTLWTFPAPPGPETTSAYWMSCNHLYYGMAAGDSGGPLFQVNGDNVPIALCGVASAPFWFTVGPFLFMGNDYAAVDPTYAREFIEALVVYHTPGNPTIDGTWAGECPPPNENAFVDTDGDGVPDACDNCPNHPNPGQENADLSVELATLTEPGSLGVLGDACDPCFGANIDSDGDGCHNACDKCPNTAGLGVNCGDLDNDDICDDVDNCTARVNKSQRNTNLVSEHHHPIVPIPAPWNTFLHPDQPFRLGDSCEPVPTPRAVIVPEEVDPFWGQLCVADTVAYEHDKFDVIALASHPMDFVTPTAIPAGNIATPLRFCHDHADIFCDDDQGIQDFWHDFRECAAIPSSVEPSCTDAEQADDYYHRMTFETGAMGNGLHPDNPAAILSYSQMAGPFEQSSALWEWSYESDFARWMAHGLFVPGEEPADAKLLKGVLWLHASTFIGDSVNLGTGLHGEQLANRHLTNYAPYREQCATAMQYAPAEGNLPMIEIKWSGIETGPDPWDRVDSIFGEAQVVLPLAEGVWGSLGGTGDGTIMMSIADGLMAEGFQYRVGDLSIRALTAVEPFWGQGAGETFPLVAWLNVDGGNELIDLATFEQGVLLSELDRATCSDHFQCVTTFCNDEENVCDASPTEPLELGAPHAIDYVGVLSRTRRGIFVIGGNDIADHETPTGEIWFLPLELGSWIPLPVDELPPEKVLAATYSGLTGSLYYLDERDDGTKVLLVQVKVDQPSATVLATFSRNPAWSRHDLVLDREGSLLLASSNPGAQKYAIARIKNLEGTPAVEGIETGGPQLVLPPVVDAEGYTLVTLGDRTQLQRARKRTLDLQGPGGLTLLGNQL